MRSYQFAIVTLCGSALILSANAEKVRFEELPIDLKDKIRVHSGAAAIEDVDRQTKGGKTQYEVGFKKNGAHTELTFSDQGQLVRENGRPVLDSRKISYAELPDAVRNTLETRTTSGEVNDIDRQMKNGEATYEVGFKQNGRQQELVLSQDGRILNDSPAVAVGAPGGTVSGTAASSGPNTLLAKPVMLSASQKVQLSQLPTEVQRAINIAAAGARIEDVDRGIWQGQNIYQAAFKYNGRHVEVQVRQNGTVLHDPRAIGSAATSSSGRAASTVRSPEYARVEGLVPLSASTKIERNALPGAVQRRLNTHVATSKIEDIERGTWNGKTVYQVAFKDENDKHIELQLDESGNVVFDPRLK